jgi:DNA primase
MREHVLALLDRYLPGSIRQGAGGNVMVKCPFHKGGEEKRPSFGINADLGLFHCFTCHVAGDVRYLLKLLGLSRSQIDAEIAVIKPELEANYRKRDFEKQHFFTNTDPFRTKWVLPEVMLGIYDWCPAKLLEDGFQMELLRDFEIGFDRLNNRITFPIRDMYGDLAGISGGRTLPSQEPKYKVYQGGYYDEKMHRRVPGDFGPWFDEEFPGFKCENHNFIWNYHRVLPRVMDTASGQDDRVFVVEGFKACLWMIQNGYMNTVAIMGSSISETQQRMLHRLGGKVMLLFDNDDAGRSATKRVGKLLWEPLHGRVEVVPYPVEDVQLSLEGQENTQPDDYEAQGIHQMVTSSLPFHIYLSRSNNGHKRVSPDYKV